MESHARRPSASAASPARLADLVLPLATLLGLAERPGEGYGLGPLDPDLCRALAVAAAESPYSRLCVTVTDPDGIAIGHGCARAARRRRFPGATSHGGTGPARRARSRTRCRGPARPGEPDDHRRPPGGTGRATGPPGRRLGLHPGHRSGTARRVRQLDADPARRQEPHRGTAAGARRSTATTGMSPTLTSRTTRSATSSRSATGSARSRPAPGTPGKPTSSTPPLMTRAGGPARATRAHAAARATR